MKDQKLLKTLIVLGLATTLTLSASAFVGCDNSKTQGGIVDPPIIVVDPPEPDKPIIEPDEPIIEPDDPVDEPDDPVIDEPDEPVIEDPDQPDNPPEEEEPEKLTEAELKENENRIYQYVAKADNSGWELDNRGNPVEVFNKEGVRDAFNEYMTTEFPAALASPLEVRLGALENIEQLFTNYDNENEKYQMGYLGDIKTPDNYGNTKMFAVLEMPIDLDDCNNSIEELSEKLSETKPREISTAMTYSYSYSNLDREYRSNRTLSEALKEKLFGDYSDDEIIFEMYAEVFDGGIGHDFGNFMSVPMACITLENDSLTLRTGSISSSMFYDGWEENLLESEVVGADCINENGDRVCVLNYGDPKPILTIYDNFYDADDEIILSVNKTNSRSNLKNIYVENKERAL